MDTIKQSRLQEYFCTCWYGLTLLIVVTMVLAGCGTVGSTSGKPTVTIGYIAGGAEPERIDTAQDLFSKRLNANVQIKYFDSGPAALAAISSGALQIIMGIGNPPTVSAISHGVPINVVWAMETTTTSEGLIVRDSSGIKTVKDLEGKTVALVEGSTSQLAFGAVLAKAGVNPSTVHLLNMSPPAIQAAWTTHAIDAAYTWDPILDTISHGDGKILTTDEDVIQQAPIFSLGLVNRNWAKSNSDLVKDFIEAENDGVVYYQQHPDDALQVIAKAVGISPDLAKTELAGIHIYSLQDQLSPDGLGQGNGVSTSLVTTSLKAAATYLQSVGTIASVPDHLEQNVNPTYVQEVLNERKS